VDRTVHPAATEQAFVRGVDDHVRPKPSDVAGHDSQLAHVRIVAPQGRANQSTELGNGGVTARKPAGAAASFARRLEAR
jgi:hypothetical protein